MMRLAETALLAAMQLTASRADYVPCDLATCTCAGVSLAQFEKGGPYRLSDPSKPGTQYALSICDTVGTAGAQNCTVNSDLGQTASFLADVGGICEALGDYNTMAAEVVAEGDHHVLHVRYNHTYGGVNQVVISFTAGSATAPGPALTQADGLYNVSWAGLTAEPPLPPPPPPPNPTPPPTPPPHAKTYECQYASCVEADGDSGPYSNDQCDQECHMYRCSAGACIEDDNAGAFPSCDDRCHLYRCNVDQCVIDDDGGTYPDNTCGGNCEAEPPPPPTPGVPCMNNCNCNSYDLSELAKDTQHGMTHVAHGNDDVHCYKFSLCGAMPANELPRGCDDWEGDGIAAVRYDCQNEDLCEVLGTTSKMFTSISTPTKSHPGQDLEIIYGRNETDSCEKTLTIAIAKPDAGKEPDHNPAGPVVDKCDKAWWYAHKANQNETCQRDCGWVVDWKGMGTSVVPHPKPPAPPPVKKGSGAGALIGVVLVVAALAAGVFVMRQKAIGPFKGRIDGGHEPLDPDRSALGGADDLAPHEKRTSW